MTEAVTKKKPVAKKTSKAAPKAPKAPRTKDGAFTVIMTGGKQYKVSVGDTLKIEKLVGEQKEGDTVTFDSVLLTSTGADTQVGTPILTGALVTATITQIGRYKTVDVIKYKQKSRYFKKYGHRQPFFQVKIDSIK